jgi:hypothetical protein
MVLAALNTILPRPASNPLHFHAVSSSLLLISIAAIFGGCSNRSNLHKYEFQEGYYRFRQIPGKFEKVYVSFKEDSVTIYRNNETIPAYPNYGVDQVYLKRGFDFDILTMPFKYRPTSQGFPRQLNANVNGNGFVGIRFDRFRINFVENPAGVSRFQTHRGMSIGAFAGLGSAAITPWTTNYRTPDEYEGLILSRGFAALVGVNNLSFGLGIGWDYLTDRDKSIWIYQNKPWWGVTVGLNLN